MTGAPITFDAQRLADWSRGAWDQPVEQAITGIVHDSRTAGPGKIYVAIKGERLDGHQFLEEVAKAGATGAMVDRNDVTADLPLLRVADTGEALKDLARAYRQSVGTLMVGITGSAGKTTVKDMLADVLETQGRTSGTKGNWNNEIGLPLSMLAMQPRSEFGVYEVGTNHPGEIGRLCDILQPICGVLTAIGVSHIGHFGSVDAIANEKADLLRSLPEDGVAVLGLDDERFAYFKAQTSARVVTVSLSDRNADYCLLGDTVYERGTGEAYPLTLPMPGEHVKQNALRALAVAREFGVLPERVVEALGNFQPGHMRWQETQAGELHIINDAYNANPLSMKAAIDAFAETNTPAGKWLVLGGMHELGDFEAEAHREIGAYAAAGNWSGVIFVGPHAKAMAAGAGDSNALALPNSSEAAAYLRAKAQPGDTILLKASRGEKLETLIDQLN